MPTLILTPRYTDDSQALWRAAIGMGWDVERLTQWKVANALRLASEPVLYVEPLMASLLAQQLGLRLLEPPLNWLPQLPTQYRKRWVRLSTLGEAKKLTTAAFVKPPNDKSFLAGTYTGQDLPRDYPDDTPVLVAEVVEWVKEFRCFILNRSLKTFSVYLRDGELQQACNFDCSEEEEEEVREFMETMLSDERVELSAATVIDIGVMRGRGWGVVEQNTAWGAGLYGCDPVKVLEVLRCTAVSL